MFPSGYRISCKCICLSNSIIFWSLHNEGRVEESTTLGLKFRKDVIQLLPRQLLTEGFHRLLLEYHCQEDEQREIFVNQSTLQTQEVCHFFTVFVFWLSTEMELNWSGELASSPMLPGEFWLTVSLVPITSSVTSICWVTNIPWYKLQTPFWCF